MKSGIRLSARGVVVRDDHLLLVTVPDRGEVVYLLPGGGVEEGEDVHAAVQRELREEAGAEVTVGPLLCVLDYSASTHFRRSIYLCFRCTLVAGSEPGLPESNIDELLGVHWVPIDDLSNINLYPSMGAKLQAALRESSDHDDGYWGVFSRDAD